MVIWVGQEVRLIGFQLMDLMALEEGRQFDVMDLTFAPYVGLFLEVLQRARRLLLVPFSCRY